MSHALNCRLVNKPGAVDLDPCPECAHDPLCRWVSIHDLARHDCDLCAFIARIRADEQERAVDRLNEAWRQSYTNGQGRLSRLGVNAAVRADEQAKP